MKNIKQLVNLYTLPLGLLFWGLGSFNLLYSQAVVLQNDSLTYNVGKYVQVLYDPAGELKIEDILSPTQQARFRRENSISDKAKHHWFKIEIDNHTDKTMFYFETYNPYHTEIYLIHNGETEHYKNGGKINDTERAYLGSYSLFPVCVGKGKSTLYVVFKALSPCKRCLEKKYFRLHAPHRIYLKHINFHVLNFSILGVLLGLMLYNLFIYWLVRDKSYVYYVVSLAGLLGYFFFYDVLQFFWYKFDYIFFFEHSTILANWFVCMAGVFFLKFSRTYLHTRLAYPAWHKILHWFMYSFIAMAIALTIGGLLRNTEANIEWYTFIFSNVCLGIITLGCMLLTLHAWQSGTPTGKYYAFSNLVFFVCVLVYVVGMIFEPLYSFTAPFVKIGITVQMLCFSVALASRINLLKQEIANKKLENERLEKERILEIQQLTSQKNVELEQKVKDRTRELQQSNEEIQTQNEEIRAQSEILQIQKQEIEEKSRLLAEAKDRQLINATLQIIQKNEILPEIGKFVEQIQANLPTEVQKEAKQILKQINQNTNTDTQWESLRMHFEQVHPNLFTDLLARCPELTNYDLRLCAYEKMGLSRKEVGILLNANADSIRKQHYRIKQKLALPEDISFTDFIKNFGN